MPELDLLEQTHAYARTLCFATKGSLTSETETRSSIGFGTVSTFAMYSAACFATYAFARSQPMPSSVVSYATTYATYRT